MSMTDSVSDMLTRIRNAALVGHKTVSFPASNLKQELCRILMEERYIRKYVVIDDNKQGIIKVLLKYKNGSPVITGLRRISRPGLRVYCKANTIPRVLSGLGVSIVSTPNGLMTDRESVKQNIGGEIVCQVW